MKDLIFLFGAGASYGSGGILPEPPPLGFQLYKILQENYPASWGSFPKEIDQAFSSNSSNDFEQGMQVIYENYGEAIPSLMREMAIYFIQFRPHNCATLYDRLINDLNAMGVLSRVLFSTLNYECVLDLSLIEQGYSISYFDEGNESVVPVWKLHGSCNMFSHGLQAGPGITYGTGISWEGGVQAFLDVNRVVQHCLTETALAPVMSLYMRGKLLNVSPSSIHQLREAWSQKVAQSAMVVCIGVRPIEDDSHIWEPIAKAESPLLFVGNHESLMGWRNSKRGITEYLGSRFHTAYTSILDRVTHYANK